MRRTHLEPMSKQLTIAVGLTVVGFMAFGLALSFYRNALFDQTLQEIREQNGALRDRIAKGYKDLEYYRSSQYKDKYAKENLGRVRPGEKVLIIAEERKNRAYEDAGEEIPMTEQREAAYLELLRQMPVLEHWKLYLFYPERIEDIKRSL